MLANFVSYNAAVTVECRAAAVRDFATLVGRAGTALDITNNENYCRANGVEAMRQNMRSYGAGQSNIRARVVDCVKLGITQDIDRKLVEIRGFITTLNTEITTARGRDCGGRFACRQIVTDTAGQEHCTNTGITNSCMDERGHAVVPYLVCSNVNTVRNNYTNYSYKTNYLDSCMGSNQGFSDRAGVLNDAELGSFETEQKRRMGTALGTYSCKDS
jgi:hypothetical protein